MVPVLSLGPPPVCSHCWLQISRDSMLYGCSTRVCACPMLFSLYISPIVHIVSSIGLLQQQYADDTQLYVAISKDNHFLALNQLKNCLVVFHTWFCHNGLALNPDKSDAIIFGTTQHTRSLQNLSTVNVAGAIVPISDHIKVLGVILDSRLIFDT